ncbi:MAG: Glu/Leu/Phe/Val dehydrogenase dimerization domain-containing protein [Candidatus Omnitrophota bacterium]|nr:Glu/Leu/Phe/Val dehydrogenase dimerization domain-containing protein [Candidatus Omnitrophota bacterium]
MKIEKIAKSGFEEILVCEDQASGLHAIIAVHNTRLGPALGGIRMHPYATTADALRDVTLLAQAMTYKSAASDLKLGGGKAVILGDPAADKSPERLYAMGRFINEFKGRYIAAKDLGITTEDLIAVAKETIYMTGLPETMGGSGDPSPWTAEGIFAGIRACFQFKLKQLNLAGVTVAIQGIGHVGLALARRLHSEGVKLIVSDTNPDLLKEVAEKLDAKAVPPDEIYDMPCEVFSPCAMGGIINDNTIKRLQCSIIAGGANNQLADMEKHDQLLRDQGILYAPDYIINAGGVINIYVKDILKEEDAMPWIRKISGHLLDVFERSAQSGKGVNFEADKLTQARLERASIRRDSDS